MLKVCLIEPEIPQNTGNIARTCAATATELILVHPLGFDISEKAVRHAGLDYWKDVKLREYPSKEAFFSENSDADMFFFSQKGQLLFSDITFNYDKDTYLIFGKESVGLGNELLSQNRERTVRIPMLDEIRCLNLSNSVAIAVYDYYRKNDFMNFRLKGVL